MYFSGQGKVFVAPLINGVPGVFRWLGNVPDFKPKFATSKLEHKESYTGQRLTDKNITTENKSTVSATLEDWSKENAALATRGTVAKSSAVAVIGEVMSGTVDTLKPGAILATKGVKLTLVSINDSTSGTPLAVSPTKYTVDADFGSVTLAPDFAVADYVLPLKISYTPAAADIVSFFTRGVDEVALRFEGVNTADANKKVLVEIYRVALDPTQELGLITEDLGKFTLEGNALVDSTKGDDVAFGKFGRLIYL